jgi:peptidoglycan/LPS O-acetylase OafA/YrhL
MHMAFALVGLAASFALMLNSQSDFACLPAAFFCGIAIASLMHEGIRPRVPEWLLSVLVLACIIVLFSFAKTHAGVPQIALVGASFYLICSGASLFGLLKLKAAQRLGHISYGIYLIQGIPMTLLFWQQGFRNWAVGSALHYWLALLICAGTLCIVASVTYALIERPFIEIGRRRQLMSKLSTG